MVFHLALRSHIKSNRFLLLPINLCNRVGKSLEIKSIQNIIVPMTILYLPFLTCFTIRFAVMSRGSPFFSKNLASLSRFLSSICLLFFTSPVSSGGGITRQTVTLVSASSVFRAFANPKIPLFEDHKPFSLEIP